MSEDQCQNVLLASEALLDKICELPKEIPHQAILLALLIISREHLRSSLENTSQAAKCHFRALVRQLDRHIEGGLIWMRGMGDENAPVEADVRNPLEQNG